MTDLEALRSLIDGAHAILSTTTLPQGRATHACDLLRCAVKLMEDLIAVEPAAILGGEGGNAIAKRGSEYFRELAAKRKTRAGARPKKAHDGMS